MSDSSLLVIEECESAPDPVELFGGLISGNLCSVNYCCVTVFHTFILCRLQLLVKKMNVQSTVKISSKKVHMFDIYVFLVLQLNLNA